MCFKLDGALAHYTKPVRQDWMRGIVPWSPLKGNCIAGRESTQFQAAILQINNNLRAL